MMQKASHRDAGGSSVRTTVTLSPANEAIIKREMKRTGQSFKDAVNTLIYRGSLARSQDSERKQPFRVRARNLGPRPGFSHQNASEMLDQLDELESKE